MGVFKQDFFQKHELSVILHTSGVTSIARKSGVKTLGIISWFKIPVFIAKLELATLRNSIEFNLRSEVLLYSSCKELVVLKFG